MKKIMNISRHEYSFDAAIFSLRLVIGFAMLTHGIPKMEGLFSGEANFPAVLGLSPEISLGMAVFAEVFCSILIILGLGTRLAVIPLIAVMGVAAFYIHLGDGFAKMEPALLYLTFYVVLFFLGSGRFSMDHLLQRRFQRSYA
jgi:putative oxidoreductase